MPPSQNSNSKIRGLYLISPPTLTEEFPTQLENIFSKLRATEIKLPCAFQLRLKNQDDIFPTLTAKDIALIQKIYHSCLSYGVPFIVNDNISFTRTLEQSLEQSLEPPLNPSLEPSLEPSPEPSLEQSLEQSPEQSLSNKHIAHIGTHLGSNDIPNTFLDASFIDFYQNKILGFSCYNDLLIAKKLADKTKKASLNTSLNIKNIYISFGAFFPTQTKLNTKHATIDLITTFKKEYPEFAICAIGGINSNNIQPLITAGADIIAISSAIWSQASSKHQISEFIALTKSFNQPTAPI